MFICIDPTVGTRLIEQGKLIRIDADGRTTDASRAPVCLAAKRGWGHSLDPEDIAS